MKAKTLFCATAFLNGLFLFSPLSGEEPLAIQQEEAHCINFNDVSIKEFIRFVGKISKVNFIFNHEELNFNVSFSSGKAVTSPQILQALFQILRAHGFEVSKRQDCYVVHQSGEGAVFEGTTGGEGRYDFFIHKLQYHQGSEIQEALKNVSTDLGQKGDTPKGMMKTIESIQWVKATNSLIYSGDEESRKIIRRLIESLDVPLRQVFIEVLVIETDIRKSLEFGLQWAAGGQINKIGFGMGNFPPGPQAPFAQTMQGVTPAHPPTGLNQIPVGSGFDMGVIGDIILHKGMSYLSLGSLVSALQIDGDSTIVLNQKIITQDNKNSTIFVGDNIPFTGSVVQTVGQSQQTTANIEYRDIGVSLSITPMLGEGDVITLDLNEEISESVHDFHASPSNTTVNGIRTTKTNMVTHVHVPDKHFLVLSGMIRNAKAHHRSGLPCLGGLPFIGAAFSKTRERDEKRNVIIFVRPHIIRSMEDFKQETRYQEELYHRQSEPLEFDEALNLLENSPG